jgi:hypothetical protein
MNPLDVTLAARSFEVGRGLPSAILRHRRLVEEPLAVVLWQLGAEPFSAAVVAWGTRPQALTLSVAGEPRNRDLAFAALVPFAHWFNAAFEAPGQHRETLHEGSRTFECATAAPQVVVANAATAELLGRLGRRLAYLPTMGPNAALADLVRLGRHLLFLRDHAAVPGQQLLVALTDLLHAHWATPLSVLERESLAALDAWIEPPAGESAFAAAARAERQAVGPLLAGEEEEQLYPLVEQFNRARAGHTDPACVRPLLGPIEAFYRPRTEAAWRLLWRCLARVRALREAPSLPRRWLVDRKAYTRHLDWLAQHGLRRTRQTARQAALTLHHLEEAGKLLEAEEACDDPLRMVPELLAHRAVRGRVVRLDVNHRERAAVKTVRRPLLTLLSPRPCLMPTGKKLWWTRQPAGKEWVVYSVVPVNATGAEVTLKLMTSSDSELPTLGTEVSFSEHTTGGGYWPVLPDEEPWTHRPDVAPPLPGPIEDPAEGRR